MKIGKKGVSPVVAVVLIILLVIVISSLIFGWARNFVSDKSEEAKSEFSGKELCEVADISVMFVGRSGSDVDFEVVNRGNVDVGGLRFRVVFEGETNIVDKDLEVLAGDAVADSVTFGSSFDDVEIFAVLDANTIGGSSDFVCTNKPLYFEGADWY